MHRSLITVVVGAMALTACNVGGGESSDAPKQPAVSAFTDGTCRVAAPDVLAIGKAGARLGTDEKVDASVKAELKDAQEGLRAVAEGAEPTYKPALQKLVESTGFVRIRADGNSYESSLGTMLMSDYATVLKVCGAAQ